MKFQTYQETLASVNCSNAIKKSQGIWAGRREYIFDDEEKKIHVSLLKDKSGWSVGAVKRYYGRTGNGPAGFDLE